MLKVLREGKEASEAKATHRAGQENRHAPAVDVFTKFEEHQGMAHLEALEILSHESEAKVSKSRKASLVLQYRPQFSKPDLHNPRLLS